MFSPLSYHNAISGELLLAGLTLCLRAGRLSSRRLPPVLARVERIELPTAILEIAALPLRHTPEIAGLFPAASAGRNWAMILADTL